MSIQAVTNQRIVDVQNVPVLKNVRSLEKSVKGLTPEQISVWIQDLVTLLPPRSESFDILEKLSEKLPLETIQEASGINETLFEEVISGLQQQMAVLDRELCSKRGSLKGRVVDWVSSWPLALENFLNAFALVDFFQISDHPDQIEQKRTKLLSVFPLISMGAVSLVSGVGVLGSVLVSLGGCAALTLMSFLYSRFRGFPTSLPKAENWTGKYHRGDLDTAFIRKKSIDEMARALSVGKKLRQFVLLCGKPGVGKTEMIKGLVHAIEMGEYPELKGKTVFYLNMAHLLNNTEANISGNRILSYLSDLMGRHRDQMILVIDGIELGFLSDIESLLGDQLKEMMNFPEEKFPYVIGISSNHRQLFKTSSRYQSLVSRSLQLHVDDLKDIEMVDLLSHSLMKTAPHVTVANPGLSLLVQKIKRVFGNQGVTPSLSLSVLSRCIWRLENFHLGLRDRLYNQQKVVERLYQEKRMKLPDQVIQGSLDKETNALQKDLKSLESQFLEIEQKFSDLQRVRSTLHEIKKALFQIASQEFINAKQKVLFILMGLYWAPHLEQKLFSESSRLGVSAEIDEPLMDEAIREELNVRFSR